MFLYNGFVHGETDSDSIKISSVKVLPDRIMLITFSNGETRVFDSSILDGPVFERLNDEEVYLHPVIEHGVVTWADGNLDCAPEYMYLHSYEYADSLVPV